MIYHHKNNNIQDEELNEKLCCEGQSMIKNCKYKEITGRKQKSGLNPFISQCDQGIICLHTS